METERDTLLHGIDVLIKIPKNTAFIASIDGPRRVNLWVPGLPVQGIDCDDAEELLTALGWQKRSKEDASNA